MRLSLSQFDEEMRPVERVLDQEWLARVLAGPLPTEFVAMGPVDALVYVQRAGLDVLLNANFNMRLRTDCAACLQSFEVDIPVRFSLTLKPRPPQSREPPEEKELTRIELEEGFYEGDELDLGAILREQILLALPMFPRCSEACKGLCPVCGADRNQQECDCEQQVVDARWATLKKLIKV